MDQLDYKLISELSKNCRLPLSSIAKNIKSNRNVIKYRLDKLEENKIITKYFTTLDLGHLKYT